MKKDKTMNEAVEVIKEGEYVKQNDTKNPNGRKLLETLIKLLAEQENVNISYVIEEQKGTSNEERKKQTRKYRRGN